MERGGYDIGGGNQGSECYQYAVIVLSPVESNYHYYQWMQIEFEHLSIYLQFTLSSSGHCLSLTNLPTGKHFLVDNYHHATLYVDVGQPLWSSRKLNFPSL